MNRKTINHWITKLIGHVGLWVILFSCTPSEQTIIITPDKEWSAGKNYQNFLIQGQAYTEKDAEAAGPF